MITALVILCVALIAPWAIWASLSGFGRPGAQARLYLIKWAHSFQLAWGFYRLLRAVDTKAPEMCLHDRIDAVLLHLWRSNQSARAMTRSKDQ